MVEVPHPTESAPEYNEYENPPFETFDEFEEALKAEPQGWLLEGIIPFAGYVMLAGAGLLGKTRTICAIIGALLKPGGGAIVAGRKAGESSVLYIHLEHQGRPLADNLKRAAKAHGVEKLTNVHLLRVFSLDDDRSVKAVADYAEAKNIGLVVIDSLRRASDGEENQSADTAGWEKQIRKLSGKGKRLVVVIHHTGKGNAGPRGSSDLRAQVDTLIELTLVEGGIELKAEHHQAAPVSFRYCLVTDDEAGTLEIAPIETPPSSTAKPSRVDQVEATMVQLVSQHPGITTTELYAKTKDQLGGYKHEFNNQGRDHAVEKGLIHSQPTPNGKDSWFPGQTVNPQSPPSPGEDSSTPSPTS